MSISAGFHALTIKTPALRILFELIDDVVDLIDVRTVCAPPIAPLRAVDATEISILVRPFIPDRDAMLVQVTHVGVAAQKPEQLVDDRFEMQLFRGEQRKSGTGRSQIETGLRTENRERPRAGAIHARLSLFEHKPKQIVILAHAVFR